MEYGTIINLLIYFLAFAIIAYMCIDAYRVSKLKKSGE
jgi:large-conductance mechanosensitive channel